MTTITHPGLRTEPERFTDSFNAAVESAASANLRTFQLENILVPAKSLESSQTAFECARWFADRAASKISVLFLPDGAFSPAGPRDLRDEIARTTGITPDKFRAILIRGGKAGVTEIANAARAEAADLIIIPANFFRESYHHFFYATPMEELIRHASCPLLIVGDKKRHPAST